MSNHKFRIEQNIFVLPIKMPGVIKNQINSSTDEKTYEVEVNYQSRIWKATFYESELSDVKETLSQPDTKYLANPNLKGTTIERSKRKDPERRARGK